MISILLITLFLVLCCVWIHVQMLVWLRRHTVRWSRSPIVKLGFIVFMLLLTHIVEIMMFAGVFYLLIVVPKDFGELAGSGVTHLNDPNVHNVIESVNEVVYFSFATYTTVGYGDITPVGNMAIMAQVEALTGLLLVGCSASLVFTFLQEFLDHHQKSQT